MTNEEAYEILEKSIRCNSDDYCPPVSCDECLYSVAYEQFEEAFQMAMEALKEPKQPDSGFVSCMNAEKMHDKTTDDLISRDEAKNGLAGLVPYAIDDVPTETYVNGLRDAYNLICNLPSVQPGQNSPTQMSGTSEDNT